MALTYLIRQASGPENKDYSTMFAEDITLNYDVI